ncbi:MAG: alkaline phosphatase family protein [Verrucomicrobia bacterium]|nr:alkaline phosphatase family protein [Verrucomicrobiota bacterium]
MLASSQMNAFGSAIALITTIISGIALMMTWSGSESVSFDRVPMEGDLSPYDLAQFRHPEPLEVASVEEEGMEEEEEDKPISTEGVSSEMAAAVAAEMAKAGAPRGNRGKRRQNQTAMAGRQASMDDTKPAMTRTPAVQVDSGGPRNRVLWISIAGFRGDYMEKAEAPFLKQMAAEGGSTTSLMPVFPSLHYPCLITQATGLPVSTHGVAGNVMRDPESKEILTRPTKLALLKSEPVWTTAKRQGLTVMVHDWPFSQEQPADAAADVFLKTFDDGKTDDVRLSGLLEAWSSYKGPAKIALAMASLHGLEKAAMANGSRDPKTFEAVTKLDSDLKTFFDKLRDAWPTLGNPGDKLYVILSTDHGRADAEKVINFGHLMGPLAEHVEFTVDSGVANIWFKEPPAGTTLDAYMKKYDEELRARIYWRSYPRGEYPSTLELGSGGPFLGDRLLVLKGGYAFSEAKGSEPVYSPSETSGPFSFGGYPVKESSRMKGQAFIFELGGGGRAADLGQVFPAQLYPTVCNLLGIKGNDGVTAEPLNVN